jgi:hypothetical protein
MPDINLNPYTAETAAIQRRLQMAQMLGQQALQPVDMPQQAGVRASHLSGLAKVLQGYMAGSEEKAATEAFKELANRYQTQGQEELSNFQKLYEGTSAVPQKELAGPAPQGAPQGISTELTQPYTDAQGVQKGGEPIQGGYIQPAQAAVPGDMKKAMAYAISAKTNPLLQNLGYQAMMDIPKMEAAKAERESQKDFLRSQQQERLAETANQNEQNRLARQSEKEQDRISRADISRESIEARKENAKLIASLKQSPKDRIEYDSARGGFVNKETQEFKPALINGVPIGAPAEKLRPIPPSINTAIIENQTSGNQIDRAIALLSGQDLPGMTGDKNATGLKAYLPTGLLNRVDPSGVNARAEIADIGSLKIHDRSGAAVTASESPRLMPFIPLATDDRDTALKKLQRLKLEINNSSAAMKEIYSTEQGYRENPILNKPSVGGKITSMQEIQEVATKTGKSVEQVKQDALAKGYKVQ